MPFSSAGSCHSCHIPPAVQFATPATPRYLPPLPPFSFCLLFAWLVVTPAYHHAVSSRCAAGVPFCMLGSGSCLSLMPLACLLHTTFLLWISHFQLHSLSPYSQSCHSSGFLFSLRRYKRHCLLLLLCCCTRWFAFCFGSSTFYLLRYSCYLLPDARSWLALYHLNSHRCCLPSTRASPLQQTYLPFTTSNTARPLRFVAPRLWFFITKNTHLLRHGFSCRLDPTYHYLLLPFRCLPVWFAAFFVVLSSLL